MKRVIFLIGLVVIVLVFVFARYYHLSFSTFIPAQTKNVESENSLTQEEKNQILGASTKIVAVYTDKGYTYSLSIKKHVGNYVRVDVTPAKGEMIDPAQVILQKKDGVWSAISFGTSFPDLYEKTPELFK